MSPTDGFLAVYLVDKDEAYCLLPYAGDPDGKQPIKHGEEYTFFSTASAPKDLKNITDEYTLTCEGEAEMNRIYILFSPNMFTKAVDYNPNKDNKADMNTLTLPRQLSMENFQKWLFDNRKRDKSMSVNIKEIIIKKKSECSPCICQTLRLGQLHINNHLYEEKHNNICSYCMCCS